MLRADVNKVYRDLILGHSLRGMDAYYIKPDDEDLKQAMNVYTERFDEQLDAAKHAEEKQPKMPPPSNPHKPIHLPILSISQALVSSAV